MGIDENKALIRRFYAEIDAGNVDAMDELVAEDYVNHHPPPFPGLATGREGLKQAFRLFWEATPGRHEIEDQIAEGDKVVTRLRGRATFTGEILGIPPNGKVVEITGISIHRIADGKLVEHWAVIDQLGMLTQLGFVTPPGGSSGG